jgi:sialidase-1
MKSWFLFSALGLIISCPLLSPVQARLAKSDVFLAGRDGYHTYRIPVLAVSTRGTLLAFCEGRKSGGSDNGNSDLLLKRSTDGGNSWHNQQVVWSDGKNTCGNPAPVVDQRTGTIWLLMTWNSGSDHEREITLGLSHDTRHVFVTHSSDDGQSWAPAADISASVKRRNWFWYATGPANGIQLTRGDNKGRLVIPANHSELRRSTNSTSPEVVLRSHVIYSDDHGITWKIGGSEDEKTNESTLVELSDGSIMQNMRSYHGTHRRAIAISRDGGQSWSRVKLDSALVEPVCQASLFRFDWPSNNNPGRILFSNPASEKRENLTIRLSDDDGASWPVSKLLQPGPSAYSCLAVLPGQIVACLYENGKNNPYQKITLARFPLNWLLGSK